VAMHPKSAALMDPKAQVLLAGRSVNRSIVSAFGLSSCHDT